MNTDFSACRETFKTLLTRLAEKMKAIGVSPKKAVEYLALFVVLGVIYYCDFTREDHQAACSTEKDIYVADLPLIFLKYFLHTAWPFAIVAALDPAWRSQDAGNVFLAAYVAANVVWFHHTGCGFCIFAASFRTIPFVFGAMLAHKIGAWRHRSRLEE